MQRSGLTLLEVLLASTLLAGIAVAVGTWTRLVSRQAVQIGDAHQSERRDSALTRLLRADASAMVDAGLSIGEGGAILRLRTMHRLPGEAPDLYAVSWRCDEGALIRSAVGVRAGTQPEPVRVQTGLRSPRFVTDAAGAVWLESASPVDDPTAITRRVLIAMGWDR